MEIQCAYLTSKGFQFGEHHGDSSLESSLQLDNLQTNKDNWIAKTIVFELSQVVPKSFRWEPTSKFKTFHKRHSVVSLDRTLKRIDLKLLNSGFLLIGSGLVQQYLGKRKKIPLWIFYLLQAVTHPENSISTRIFWNFGSMSCWFFRPTVQSLTQKFQATSSGVSLTLWGEGLPFSATPNLWSWMYDSKPPSETSSANYPHSL